MPIPLPPQVIQWMAEDAEKVAKFRRNLEDPRQCYVESLRPGTSVWALPWSFYRTDASVYFQPNHPVARESFGNFTVPMVYTEKLKVCVFVTIAQFSYVKWIDRTLHSVHEYIQVDYHVEPGI